MVRRGSSTKEPDVTDDAVEEQVAVEDNEAADSSSAESAESKADKVELSDEQKDEAIQPFLAQLEGVVALRDENTGELTGEDADKAVAELNKAYTNLDGIKLKNHAKAAVADKMKDAMGKLDAQLARSYMDAQALLAAGKAKSTGGRTPRKPVNPTEAFTERVATLELASYLVGSPAVPEGVDEDWRDKATTLYNSVDMSAVTAYQNWLDDDSEDKGDEPESATAVIKAAVKLSRGKAAKPGKANRAAGGGSTFDGPRRDIAKHIAEAFAGENSGTWKSIADIAKFKSDEYGDDRPSAGAISARLYPSSGKCTVEGITPEPNDTGHKGASKD